MKAYLHIKDLWVDPEVAYDEHTPEARRKSDSAYHHIIMYVDMHNQELINDVTNSINAWIILSAHHQGRSMSSIILSKASVMTLRISDKDTMQDHTAKLTSYFNKLSEQDCKLPDEVQIAMMLASLSGAGYDSLVTGFMAWSKQQLTVTAMKNAMMEAYTHKLMNSTTHNEVGFQVQRDSNNRRPMPPVNYNHNKYSPRDNVKREVQCTYSKIPGHYVSQCHRKIYRDNSQQKSNNFSNNGNKPRRLYVANNHESSDDDQNNVNYQQFAAPSHSSDRYGSHYSGAGPSHDNSLSPLRWSFKKVGQPHQPEVQQ